MTIVTNTGPLIILAKIDQLDLLRQMFTSVAIPPAVHRELMAKSGIEVRRLDAALTQFIEISVEPHPLKCGLSPGI
jgi:predicted nucleic acid-binding protein